MNFHKLDSITSWRIRAHILDAIILKERWINEIGELLIVDWK